MDCKQVDQILMDYIYEEIDQAEVATIESHLKACARCAEEVESFQQTRSMVGVFEQLEPPAAVTQLLIEEAQRAAPDQQSFFARLRSTMRVLVMHPALSAAAMLVVVLGVSFFAYRKGLPPARRDVPVSDTPELPLGVDPGHQATLSVPAGTAASDERSVDKKRQQEQKVALGGLQQTGNSNEPLQGQGRGYRRRAQADQDLGDREEEGSRLRTTGPTKMEATLQTKRPNRVARSRPRAAPKTAYPAAQKAPNQDSTYDQLAKQGAGKGAAAAEVVKVTERPKRKKAAAPSSRLRRRTRRAASVSNVGSGSTGVWSGRRAGKAARAPAPTKSRGDAFKSDDAHNSLDNNALGAKDRRDKLLLGGRRFVRAGKCEMAFSYFVKVLKTQPALIDQVAVELSPCVPQLQASKRHQGLAKRVQRSKVRRRRAAEADMAAKAATKKTRKASPPKSTTAH